MVALNKPCKFINVKFNKQKRYMYYCYVVKIERDIITKKSMKRKIRKRKIMKGKIMKKRINLSLMVNNSINISKTNTPGFSSIQLTQKRS